MNNSIKKLLVFMAAAAVSVSALISAPCAMAQSTSAASANGTVTINRPEDNNTTASNTTEDNTTAAPADGETQAEAGSSLPVPTAVAVQQNTSNVVETGQAQKEADRHYSSKGFVILWFFLSVIVNVILSFLIANRFYKLSRRENHVTSEIRALRRDLEEKFANSVDGFSEMETDVTNTNENYSRDGSIELGAKHKDSYGDDSDDVFRQWENRMAKRAARTIQSEEAPEAPEENEIEEPEDEPRRIKSYRPTRDDEEIIVDEEEIAEEGESLKDKAKGIIGNIFPFNN